MFGLTGNAKLVVNGNRKLETDFGPLEILVVLAAVIIIFGIGRLPKIGGSLGKNIREFRSASQGEDENPPRTEEAALPPAPSRNAFCTECGVAALPGIRFCTACGHSLAHL